MAEFCAWITRLKKKNHFETIQLRLFGRVKYIFGTCDLKTSFFGTLVSFRFTDDTYILEKIDLVPPYTFPSKF
jgi:hypothetical protein